MTSFSIQKHRNNDSELLDALEIGWIKAMLKDHPKEMKHLVRKVCQAYNEFKEQEKPIKETAIIV